MVPLLGARSSGSTLRWSEYSAGSVRDVLATLPKQIALLPQASWLASGSSLQIDSSGCCFSPVIAQPSGMAGAVSSARATSDPGRAILAVVEGVTGIMTEPT